jgi:pimeloyl-ACP methyl ester carboxylesterase
MNVATNGIELGVRDEGEGRVVVLAHGFPELAHSWRHQVPVLVEAGYRVLAPDMRGFGASSRPSDVEAYDVLTVGRDLIGLLDAVGEDRAIFVGHDWGATVAWQLAITHPDRVMAVAGMSVPFAPRPPVAPMSIFRRRLGDDFYQAWFQEPGAADEAFARNVRRTLTITGRLDAPQEWTAAWASRSGDPVTIAPWLTEDDLDVYAEAFERTGFTGGLNYYRNIDRNWALTEPFGERRIEQPAIFITGSEDLVRRFMPGRGMESWLTDLREHLVLDGAGHWIQQERPAEVNAALLRFLQSVTD